MALSTDRILRSWTLEIYGCHEKGRRGMKNYFIGPFKSQKFGESTYFSHKDKIFIIDITKSLMLINICKIFLIYII